MNGPYSVPLKTDIDQQSNSQRLILQLTKHMLDMLGDLYFNTQALCNKAPVCTCGHIPVASVNINA